MDAKDVHPSDTPEETVAGESPGAGGAETEVVTRVGQVETPAAWCDANVAPVKRTLWSRMTGWSDDVAPVKPSIDEGDDEPDEPAKPRWVPTRSTNSRTSRRSHVPNAMLSESSSEQTWRTPALATLARPSMSPIRRAGLFTLRAYPVLAVALVVAKIVQVGIGVPVPVFVR